MKGPGGLQRRFPDQSLELQSPSHTCFSLPWQPSWSKPPTLSPGPALPSNRSQSHVKLALVSFSSSPTTPHLISPPPLHGSQRGLYKEKIGHSHSSAQKYLWAPIHSGEVSPHVSDLCGLTPSLPSACSFSSTHTAPIFLPQHPQAHSCLRVLAFAIPTAWSVSESLYSGLLLPLNLNVTSSGKPTLITKPRFSHLQSLSS